MTTLYHEITALTSPGHVWNLLTTRNGLNKWWPGEVTINGGDSWRFHQDEANLEWVFRVVEEESQRVLEWLCVQGEDDFHNTLIHWRIEQKTAGLVLILEHRDLHKPAEQLAALNTHWGTWIDRIREQLHLEIETMDDKDLNAWT